MLSEQHKTINEKLYNNKLALQYFQSFNDKVKTLCQPLNDYIGISCFAYIKVYKKNSKYLYISNDIALTEDYLFNVSWSNIFYKDHLKTTRYDAILWPSSPETENKSMQIYFKHNYWNGITLLADTTDYVEGFCFLANKDNYRINDFYIRNTLTLERFANYFQNKLHNDILVEDNGLYSKYSEGFNFSVPLSNDNENENARTQSFLKAIGYQRGRFEIGRKQIQITQSELECLELLTQGYSYKEIAKQTDRSHRTVETLLNRIKAKTGTHYKSELVRFYNENSI